MFQSSDSSNFLSSVQGWFSEVVGGLDFTRRRPTPDSSHAGSARPMKRSLLQENGTPDLDATLAPGQLLSVKEALEEQLNNDLQRLADERKNRLTLLDQELAEAVEALHEDTARRARERIAGHREAIAQIETRLQDRGSSEGQLVFEPSSSSVPRQDSVHERSGDEESEEEQETPGILNRFMGLLGARAVEPAFNAEASGSSSSSSSSASEDEEDERPAYLPSGDSSAERGLLGRAPPTPGRGSEDVLPRFDALGATSPGAGKAGAIRPGLNGGHDAFGGQRCLLSMPPLRPLS